MKILILDDDGSTLYEQDNPGYIHLPDIIDDKHAVDCEEDDCPDPRCIERRKDCEVWLDRWVQRGTELALVKHPATGKWDEFIAMPHADRQDKKLKLVSWTRNELVFDTGERVSFFLPSLNVYSSDQVMFSTNDAYAGSLSPWDSRIHGRERNV